MAARRDYRTRTPHAVFSMIDMRGGNKNECWPWLGTCAPNPVFFYNRKRWQARRMIYSLRKGIHYNDVPRGPKIIMTCGNTWCCNPFHMTERFGTAEKINGFASTKLTSSRKRRQVLCECV